MPYVSKEDKAEYDASYREANKARLTEQKKRYRQRYPEKAMFLNAKHRALAKGIEFTITEDDIKIPTHCPALGIPLTFAGESRWDSPSLDRIDPTKGYTKDNIVVISNKANAIKTNANFDEILKVGNWLKEYNVI